MALERIRAGVMAALLIAVLFLSACGDTLSQDGEKPASLQAKGYYASTQVFSGGQGVPREGNITALEMKTEGADMVLTFSFASGMGASAQTVDVPSFRLSGEQTPYRLKIEVEGLMYHDFRGETVNSILPEGLKGFFVPEGSRSMLFLQFASDYTYKVNVSGSALTLRVRMLPMGTVATHHVLCDIVDIAQGASFGLTPTMCRDGRTQTFISKAYARAQDAAAAAVALSSQLQTQGIAAAAEVCTLAPGELPASRLMPDAQALAQELVFEKDAAATTLSVAFAGGRVLCFAPEGSDALYSVPVPETDIETGQPTQFDQLWIQNAAGEQARLLDTMFQSVQSAKYSPDGRKIAFVEMYGMMNLLYVYDLDEKTLSNVSEEGFGSNTWGYAWNATSSALFAMAGEDLSQCQLKKYDLHQGESRRIQALEELPGTDGAVGYANGFVYFTDPSNDEVIRLPQTGGARQRVTNGTDFCLSNDHKMAAVYSSLEESGVNAPFRILNLVEGGEKPVEQNVYLADVKWSTDGKALYYLVDMFQSRGIELEYNYELRAYDVESGQSSVLGRCRAAQIMPTDDPDKLLIVDTFSHADFYFPATFVLDVGK